MPSEKLFVPLKTEFFLDFQDRGKEYELRKYGRNFTERNVYPGRRVLLRNGYSGKAELWGTVGRVVIGSLESIFREVDYKLIEPRAKTINEARGNPEDKEIYLAFQVLIDKK